MEPSGSLFNGEVKKNYIKIICNEVYTICTICQYVQYV